MNTYWQIAEMKDLLNETPVKIEQSEYDGNDSIVLTMLSGREFMLVHRQDCCESVNLESIDGDIQRLLNNPITISNESYNDGNSDNGYESSTWSFYHIGTVIDTVTIRFYGSSNGYYSESASLLELK
jgi:hypothetical protein